MKGSVIALALVLAGGFLVWFLLRDNFADLLRLESEARASLEQANADLDAATRSLTVLRAVRPNLSEIDKERAALQQQFSDQKKNLERLAGERPAARDSRVQFIEQRRSARDAAKSLAEAVHSLAERAALMDDFTKNGQPTVKALNEAIQRTFDLKNQLVAAGKTVDPVLANRLEQMQKKRGSLQDMAKGFYAGASGVKRSEREEVATVDKLRTEAKTIENESKALIADLEAAYKELESVR